MAGHASGLDDAAAGTALALIPGMRWVLLVGVVGGLGSLSACRIVSFAPASDASIEPESCEEETLAEYCKHDVCPSSPDAVIELICGSSFRTYHVQSNECSGTTVRYVVAPDQVQYHYDEHQKLIGVTLVRSTADSCGETVRAYGKRCTDLGRAPQGSRCNPSDAGADDDAN
jgi:hypothetical protein